MHTVFRNRFKTAKISLNFIPGGEHQSQLGKEISYQRWESPVHVLPNLRTYPCKTITINTCTCTLATRHKLHAIAQTELKRTAYSVDCPMIHVQVASQVQYSLTYADIYQANLSKYYTFAYLYTYNVYVLLVWTSTSLISRPNLREPFNDARKNTFQCATLKGRGGPGAGTRLDQHCTQLLVGQLGYKQSHDKGGARALVAWWW